MKKYFFLIMMLMSALGIRAQWDMDLSNYHESHVIYAELVTNENYSLTSYIIGAFIGDECRGSTRPTQEPTTGLYYFNIRVWGDATADAGREITFKVFNSETNKTFDVTPQSTVNWVSEGTTGELSNLFQISLTAATSMSLPEKIEMKLGETINLRDYITVTPEGASLPLGRLPWVINSYGDTTMVAIDDYDMLTALKVTTGVPLQVYNNDGSLLLSTTLVITNPATSLAIKDEYKDGVTVNKNDSRTLTNIINNCLIIEPENYTDELKWVIGDQTIIAPPGAAANLYTPIAGGQTTMTARILNDDGTVRLSAVLNVTVVVPVEGIELEYPVDLLYANVGDDFGSRITPIVKVLPEDATNKEVTWTVDDNTIVSLEGTTMKALKSGRTLLNVTSVDNPDVGMEINVVVQNPARTITINEETINVEYFSGVLDISEQVRSNIVIGPEGYDRLEQGYIVSSDTSVVNTEDSWITGNGVNIDVKVKSAGTSTINITLMFTDFNGQRADYTPDYSNASVSGTFTINAIQGLTGFEMTVGETTRGEGAAVTLTPIPADANLDPSLITVEVVPNTSLPQGWTSADVTSQGDGKNFTITPAMPGQATVVAYYDGEPMGEASIDVGMPISLSSGWQWVSIPYVSIAKDKMLEVFGNNLVEIRSQDKLLYNDPQYGYFGTLYESGLNQYEGYKVKMNGARTYSLSGGSLNLENGEISLNTGWTWMVNPYYYDRSITDVVNGRFNEGDRIVSKNDGFAEYSGGRWTGTLTLLRAGQGYMFYNAGGSENLLSYVGESTLPQQNAAAGAKRMGMRDWDYDASQFDDNLSMVALITSVGNMADYTVGAYVGDECRGEGVVVEGKLFVTVHGKAGERVNFIAHNEATNEYFPIAESVTLQPNLGIMENPFELSINGGATGIDSIRAAFLKGAKSWNLRGVEMPVNTPQKGVRIIRMEDGKTVKTTK